MHVQRMLEMDRCLDTGGSFTQNNAKKNYRKRVASFKIVRGVAPKTFFKF